MNDPHREPEIGMADAQQDDLFEVTPTFLAFARKAFKVWQSSSADGAKGDEVRALFMAALANRSEDDETSIHTDGPVEPHTQGIDDSRLESVDANGFPRDRNGKLLGNEERVKKPWEQHGRQAADVLEGGNQSEEDVEIEQAVNRRLAKRLMSAPNL